MHRSVVLSDFGHLFYRNSSRLSSSPTTTTKATTTTTTIRNARSSRSSRRVRFYTRRPLPRGEGRWSFAFGFCGVCVCVSARAPPLCVFKWRNGIQQQRRVCLLLCALKGLVIGMFLVKIRSKLIFREILSKIYEISDFSSRRVLL